MVTPRVLAPVAGAFAPAALAQSGPSPEEARAIAKEAYIYGFPMVDNYRVQYAYFQDPTNPCLLYTSPSPRDS